MANDKSRAALRMAQFMDEVCDEVDLRATDDRMTAPPPVLKIPEAWGVAKARPKGKHFGGANKP